MRTSQNINNRAISNSATVHIHKGNELCMLNYICTPSAHSLPHHTQWLKPGLSSSRSVYKGQVEYSYSVLISNLWKKGSIYDNIDEPGIRTSETWNRQILQRSPRPVRWHKHLVLHWTGWGRRVLKLRPCCTTSWDLVSMQLKTSQAAEMAP